MYIFTFHFEQYGLWQASETYPSLLSGSRNWGLESQNFCFKPPPPQLHNVPTSYSFLNCRVRIVGTCDILSINAAFGTTFSTSTCEGVGPSDCCMPSHVVSNCETCLKPQACKTVQNRNAIGVCVCPFCTIETEHACSLVPLLKSFACRCAVFLKPWRPLPSLDVSFFCNKRKHNIEKQPWKRACICILNSWWVFFICRRSSS